MIKVRDAYEQFSNNEVYEIKTFKPSMEEQMEHDALKERYEKMKEKLDKMEEEHEFGNVITKDIRNYLISQGWKAPPPKYQTDFKEGDHVEVFDKTNCQWLLRRLKADNTKHYGYPAARGHYQTEDGATFCKCRYAPNKINWDQEVDCLQDFDAVGTVYTIKEDDNKYIIYMLDGRRALIE